MSKKELQGLISTIETKLEQTKEAAKWGNGPVDDALLTVIPMMEDQLTVIKALFHNHYGPPEE